ncbi:MAG: hypothetical protein IKZ16_06100, partial [Clostridia bacterium]|nr:hypothetical protein [Clostridia bacterium]
MKKKEWIIAALLLLTCALSACSTPQAASDQRTEQPPPLPAYLQSLEQGETVEVAPPNYALREAAPTMPVEQYIYECLMEEQIEIDLSAYRVSVARISTLYTDVLNQYPELFFVHWGISYHYTTQGFVVTLKPTYIITGDALEQARTECAQRLDEICADVDSTWSDFEIALYLHDYLCLHFAYDTTYQIFDMYQFLTTGTGVCQAYTLTYTALLQRYGIQSDVAISEEMNHIWNIVTLGGQPYHVDVTWDDPLPDTQGSVLHQNFLRSDAGIAKTEHFDWVADQVCSSDVYESTFVVEVAQPFCYTAGQWFYADGQARKAFAVDFSTMRKTEVLSITDKWVTANQGSYYVDAFWNVGTYRGNLIYNTPKRIYAYHLQSGKRVEVKIDLPRRKQLVGLWVDGDILYYSVADSPDSQTQTYSCSIAQLTDYIWGDADQNGVVDG